MNDFSSKITAYKNTNVTKCVNEAMVKYEKSVVDTQIYNLKHALKELDREVFKGFILNSDTLLEILNAYESTYLQLLDVQDVASSIRRLIFKLSENVVEVHSVNPVKVEEFRSILANFSADLSTFDTGSRYLVHFAKLYDDDSNKYILIMTNDLLIIGLIDDYLKKYKLINAFNYSILKISVVNDQLNITLPQEVFKYKGESKGLGKIVDIYKELTYSYSDDDDKREDINNSKESELYEYYMFTEQFDKLKNLKCNLEKRLYFYDKKSFFDYINSTKTNFDITLFVCDFFLNKFKESVSSINKIKPTKELVDDLFDLFYKFFDQQQDLISSIESVFELKKENLIFLYEDEIKLCLKCLENRVFSRRFLIENSECIINQIKDKLKFENYNFSYLIEGFDQKRDEHNRFCISDGKNDIENVIGDMVNRDYQNK